MQKIKIFVRRSWDIELKKPKAILLYYMSEKFA